ncbi:MAG TPA: hypothetical protein V6D28_08725 [Leptolyngbyaceae cyanobacterium]
MQPEENTSWEKECGKSIEEKEKLIKKYAELSQLHGQQMNEYANSTEHSQDATEEHIKAAAEHVKATK